MTGIMQFQRRAWLIRRAHAPATDAAVHQAAFEIEQTAPAKPDAMIMEFNR